jgi:uncharacterized Zn finger protein (UPF0148 family)
MKTVNTFEKVRDAQQTGNTVCPTCLKKVEKIELFFVTVRKTYENKIEALVREMRDDFKEILKKGDFDGGEDIQDVGNKGKAASGRSE